MYIKVKVHAGAREEKVVRKAPDHYEVWVKEKAERNLANKRVQEIIAWELNVTPAKARLVSGHHSPSKIFSIHDDVV